VAKQVDWEKYQQRAKILNGIREYFVGRNFLEVETPLLLPTVSTEPYLEVFETKLMDDLGGKRRMFLPTSPEYAMKKLLSRGSGSIFQITKSFRNGEGESPKHNPEFTILEWYEVGGDYMSVVEDFAQLMRRLLKIIKPGADKLTYQGREYDLAGSWEKISLAEAFWRYAGIEEEVMLDERKLKRVVAEKGYQVRQETTWEEVWNQIIANEVEPRLGTERPTVLYNYPVAQAALAKKATDMRYAERAEVFLAGMELGNIFSELTDYKEQEARCRADLVERAKLGKSEYPMDEEFIAALKAGMPETGGIAVGVDRLVMLLTDASEIREVIHFPVDYPLKAV